MREILYKGKRKDNGEWVEGYYVYRGEEYSTIDTNAHFIVAHDMCGLIWYEVIPESVSEFTGLPDNNGKKIFEGDIVKAVFKPYFIGSYAIGKVVFENGTFKIAVYQSKNASTYKKFTKETARAYSIENNFIDRNYSLEVIGNIHDNPELLKGGDEK